MAKVAKVSAKKPSTKTPKTGEKSDNGTAITPDGSKDRGIGSSFAYAVETAISEGKEAQADQNNFLGVAQKTIDTKQFAHELKKN